MNWRLFWHVIIAITLPIWLPVGIIVGVLAYGTAAVVGLCLDSTRKRP